MDVNGNVCPHCGEFYKTKKILRQHIDRHHYETKDNFVCFVACCNRKYSTKSSLKGHIRTSHGFTATDEQLKESNEPIPNTGKKQPKNKPRARKNVKCHICDRIFTTKFGRDRHIENQHNKQSCTNAVDLLAELFAEIPNVAENDSCEPSTRELNIQTVQQPTFSIGMHDDSNESIQYQDYEVLDDEETSEIDEQQFSNFEDDTCTNVICSEVSNVMVS